MKRSAVHRECASRISPFLYLSFDSFERFDSSSAQPKPNELSTEYVRQRNRDDQSPILYIPSTKNRQQTARLSHLVVYNPQSYAQLSLKFFFISFIMNKKNTPWKNTPRTRSSSRNNRRNESVDSAATILSDLSTTPKTTKTAPRTPENTPHPVARAPTTNDTDHEHGNNVADEIENVVNNGEQEPNDLSTANKTTGASDGTTRDLVKTNLSRAFIDSEDELLQNPFQEHVVSCFIGIEKSHADAEKEEILFTIRNELSVWALSRVEMFSNYNIYRSIRRFLENHDIPVPSSVANSSIVMIRVVAAIWPQDEFKIELDEALHRWNGFRDGSISIPIDGNYRNMTPREYQRSDRAKREEERERLLSRATITTHPTRVDTTTVDDTDSHSSHSSQFVRIQNCYKHKHTKFGGESDENWTMTLAKYEHFAEQLKLTEEQKLRYIHAIFRDDAEHFYFSELKNTSNWTDIVSNLNKRYNNDARIRAVKDELKTITLMQFSQDGTCDAKALQLLARRIEKLVPQCYKVANCDEEKREALYYAVRNAPWSEGPINALVGSGYQKSYKSFLDELITAEQQYRLRKGDTAGISSRTRYKTDSTNRRPTGPSKGPINDAIVWYQSQGRYGRDPKAR